jgi:hypothetical protein
MTIQYANGRSRQAVLLSNERHVCLREGEQRCNLPHGRERHLVFGER